MRKRPSLTYALGARKLLRVSHASLSKIMRDRGQILKSVVLITSSAELCSDHLL